MFFIDFYKSTGYCKTNRFGLSCDSATGYIHHGCPHPWQADPLPRYVWLPEGEGHPGCLYKPEMEAIKFLINFMKAKALLHAEA